MKRAMRRFIKYFGVGASTFLFDLALLSVLIDVFSMHYAPAAGLAFIIAVSVNYGLSRRYVFPQTLRSTHTGYAIFILIAFVGMGAVMGGMVLFVSVLGWHYMFSRVVIAGVVGIWNYLMNLYVNFRVVGKHESL